MIGNNEKSFVKNQYQGKSKKVLCVCSAGLLRSPTAAWVLSNPPYNFNTRSCGIERWGLVPVTDLLLEWADEIVVMDVNQQIILKERTKKPVLNLSIPDHFEYRQKELVNLIRQRYEAP